MNDELSDQNALDAAISRRLARLGQREIDVSGLERKLTVALANEAAASPGESTAAQRPLSIRRWLSPAVGIAATLVLAATLFLIIGTNPPSASATVMDLTQLHSDLVAGRIALEPSRSVDQVNDTIAMQQSAPLSLPVGLEGTRVQSCCLADVDGEIIALSVLDDGGPAVTFVVARAPSFAHEMGTAVTIGDRTFFGHEVKGVNMMMANRADHWLCVMGDRGNTELAELAGAIEF